jgi:ankyrin repeat protein
MKDFDSSNLLINDSLLSFIDVFVKAGADVNAVDDDGTTPLFVAAMFQEITGIQSLIDYGADFKHINDYGDGLLSTLFKFGRPCREIEDEIVRLAETRKTSERDFNRCLWLVAGNGNISLLKRLLETGLKHNGQSLFATLKHIKCAEILLDSGLNPNITNETGDTLLGLVIKNKSNQSRKYVLDFVSLLVEKGADTKKFLDLAQGDKDLLKLFQK